MKRTPVAAVATFFLSLGAAPVIAQHSLPPIPETTENTIGYETVAAALAGLRKQPGTTFTTENGWLIATDEATLSIWSFAPEGYPAYPAVVKRQAIPHGHGSVIQMYVLCEASKAACDDLVRAFRELLP